MGTSISTLKLESSVEGKVENTLQKLSKPLEIESILSLTWREFLSYGIGPIVLRQIVEALVNRGWVQESILKEFEKRWREVCVAISHGQNPLHDQLIGASAVESSDSLTIRVEGGDIQAALRKAALELSALSTAQRRSLAVWFMTETEERMNSLKATPEERNLVLSGWAMLIARMDRELDEELGEFVGLNALRGLSRRE